MINLGALFGPPNKAKSGTRSLRPGDLSWHLKPPGPLANQRFSPGVRGCNHVTFSFVCDDGRLKQLENENRELARANALLREELELLKAHPVLQAGLRGEKLICDLVEGTLTSYAAGYDVAAGKCKIEVKYSNLGTPVKGRQTRRWSWSKPLGWQDKGKGYDYLVLIGERDDRFPHQYLDDTCYVCFLIPRPNVEKLMFKGKSIGGIIQLTTNFKAVSNKQSRMLLEYMVPLSAVLTLMQSSGEAGKNDSR